MTLGEYVEKYGWGTLMELSRDSDVSYTTIQKAARGEAIGRWDVARRISEATEGEVSIEELCEPGEAA